MGSWLGSWLGFLLGSFWGVFYLGKGGWVRLGSALSCVGRESCYTIVSLTWYISMDIVAVGDLYAACGGVLWGFCVPLLFVGVL